MEDKKEGEDKLLYRKEVFSIVGAAMEVHTELKHGYAEAVYHESLAMEFDLRTIPYEPEKRLLISYKGRPLQKHYIADFVCYGQIIVEIKAISKLTDADRAQIINYLKATGCKIGVLINFGSVGKLEWERFIF